MSGIFGYTRCSTNKQEFSIEAQRTRIQAYASAANIVLEDILNDEAESASKTPFGARPAGERITRMIESGACRTVVACKLDRLFRSTAEALATISTWTKKGVAVVLLDFGGQPIDSRTATGKLILTMFAAVGQFERDVISERTKAGMAQAAAEGRRVSRADRTPYGSKSKNIQCPVCLGQDPDRSTCLNCKRKGYMPMLEQDELELFQINRIVCLHEGPDHFGPFEIAQILETEGLRAREGKPWQGPQVTLVLKAYLGSDYHYTPGARKGRRHGKKIPTEGELGIVQPFDEIHTEVVDNEPAGV
jgi:DNA invertase Pin-like site-specific DNA recombinase